MTGMCMLAGLGDFGIVGGDGGTGDHDFGAGDVLGACAPRRCGAQRRQALRDGGGLQIGAGDLVAEVQQDLGNAAHADAADAYEMDALDFGKHGKSAASQIAPSLLASIG